MPRLSRRPSKKSAARSPSSDRWATSPPRRSRSLGTGFFMRVPRLPGRRPSWPGCRREARLRGRRPTMKKAPLTAGPEDWNVPGESVLVSTLGFVPHSSHVENLNRSFPLARAGRPDHQVAATVGLSFAEGNHLQGDRTALAACCQRRLALPAPIGIGRQCSAGRWWRWR